MSSFTFFCDRISGLSPSPARARAALLFASALALRPAVGAAADSGYVVSTLAGHAALGYVDGPGATAAFALPTSVAVDHDGNLFVTDTFNRVIRKITPAHVVSTFAGQAGRPGSVDGLGTQAQFQSPTYLTIDRAGNLFVSDNTTVRKITPAGLVQTLAGQAGSRGWADGPGATARFGSAAGIAVDKDGNILVADPENVAIRKITSSGIVSTVAGKPGNFGTTDGPVSEARFADPMGVAADSQGTIYVSDVGADTIRFITPAGTVGTLAGLASSLGSADGTGSAARFNFPSSIAVDRFGNLYVTDNLNGTIRKITSGGVVTTFAGISGSDDEVDGVGSAARFDSPNGAATDDAGNVFVADSNGGVIRQITPNGSVTTIAGAAGSVGGVDGRGDAARFNYPLGLAADSKGNVYVADNGNSTIRRVARDGTVTTIAGAREQSGAIDGPGNLARFYFPSGVALDRADNLYVADESNYLIRKITPDGVVSTIAGSPGNPGWDDGTGGAARFQDPISVAVDGAGNVFVADRFGPTIRKITPTGVVSTFAGLATVPGTADGIGAAARFSQPIGIVTDRANNLYVADSTGVIRKITPDAVVTTLAGKAGSHGHVDGSGDIARFGLVVGISADDLGNVFVSEQGGVVRRITSAGVVSTVLGTFGVEGGADGDGSVATFNFPAGITVDRAGNLFVADSGNNTIRKAVSTTRLVNLSVRGDVESGDQTLIVGFAVAGAAPKPILVRAVGPSLASMGILNGLDDPRLTLFNAAGAKVQENDNWGGAQQLSDVFTAVGAFPLDAASKDSALYGSLAPNQYTAQVASADGTGGIALLEAYDAGSGRDTRFVNASVRAVTSGGQNLLIAGFVLSGTAPKTLLLRGVGPSLARLGVNPASLLTDPKITLYRGSTLITENDDWGGSADLKNAFHNVGAFDLNSDTSKDSALQVMLDPGLYTVVLSGVNNTTGVALVEVYEVP